MCAWCRLWTLGPSRPRVRPRGQDANPGDRQESEKADHDLNGPVHVVRDLAAGCGVCRVPGIASRGFVDRQSFPAHLLHEGDPAACEDRCLTFLDPRRDDEEVNQEVVVATHPEHQLTVGVAVQDRRDRSLEVLDAAACCCSFLENLDLGQVPLLCRWVESGDRVNYRKMKEKAKARSCDLAFGGFRYV